MQAAEADLIDAALRGDGAAFDALVARHMKPAFAVAYRVLGHREDAEDVVQDACVAALEKLHTFQRGRSFGPWLLRIVFNRGLNLRKARALRQMQEIPEHVAANGASPLELAERSELRDGLRRALAALPERRRWIVQMFDIDGFSGPEIAQILGLPDGTVRWELHQARGTLRTALDAHARRNVI